MARMLLFIGLGGALGAVARFGLSGLVQPNASTFPWGTLTVNVLGSFALGFLMRFLLGSAVATAEMRAGLTIGFCGSFTTMSTFSYETISLLNDGAHWQAARYATASFAGSLTAVIAGAFVGGRLL